MHVYLSSTEMFRVTRVHGWHSSLKLLVTLVSLYQGMSSNLRYNGRMRVSLEKLQRVTYFTSYSVLEYLHQRIGRCIRQLRNVLDGCGEVGQCLMIRSTERGEVCICSQQRTGRRGSKIRGVCVVLHYRLFMDTPGPGKQMCYCNNRFSILWFLRNVN